MTDRTPASEAREAAKRLRALAAAARELTEDGNGRWFPWSVIQDTKWVKWPESRPVPVPFAFDGSTEMADGDWEPTGEAFVAHARYAHDQEEDWHEAEFIGGQMPEPVARYIASVHPGFGLELADWLDAVAEQAEQSGNWALHSLSPGPLKVARAYLGTQEEATGQ